MLKVNCQSSKPVGFKEGIISNLVIGINLVLKRRVVELYEKSLLN